MSELRANTISDSAGTGPVTLTGQYAAKAWVNFNGTGTVAIRESGNVSSITDNGTGNYTVNFTTSMIDSNYTSVGSSEGTDFSATFQRVFSYANKTTANFRVFIVDLNGPSYSDRPSDVNVFR